MGFYNIPAHYSTGFLAAGPAHYRHSADRTGTDVFYVVDTARIRYNGVLFISKKEVLP